MLTSSRRIFLFVFINIAGCALAGCTEKTTGQDCSKGSASSSSFDCPDDSEKQVMTMGDDGEGIAWSCLLLGKGQARDGASRNPLSRMERYYTLKTSNLIVWDDGVLVGAGAMLLCLSCTRGEILSHFELLPCTNHTAGDDIMSIAAFNGMVYAATSAGNLVSIDFTAGELRWATLVCPVQSEESTGNLPGAWLSTDIVLLDGAVVVGFSSYQFDDTSTLLCIETADGAVRWSRQLEGRLDTAGGIGYPVAVDAGLLLPMPDGSGLGLLSTQTGETLDLLETDSPIYMGLAMSDGGGLPCYFQSKLGTLYKVDVENGALVAASAKDACTDSTKRVPSGARPLLADGHVIVNAATQDEDAKRFDGDYNPSAGECVVFDAETLEVLERHDAPEIESTPIHVDEGMYYLGRAGIYRAALEDGVPSEPELVFNTEGRDRDVWEQQLLAADGMLYFVGGPYGERWLYAVK